MTSNTDSETFTITDEDGEVSSHTYSGCHAQFVRDMVAADIPWRHYGGRFYYQGPAACSDRRAGITVQDIHRATKIRCQQDNMGLDYVLYPA